MNRMVTACFDILKIMCLCLLIASCCSPSGVHTVDSPQDSVDAFVSLAPNYLDYWKCNRSELDFDVNDYFSVLDHLSMEPGYVLDYIYLCDPGGVIPIVYARPSGQPPYATYGEFLDAVGGPQQGSYEYIEHSDDYLEHVQIDGTAEGYFQFVVLWIMEDQFDLYWHGGYNDTTVVCDRRGVEKVLSATEEDFLYDRTVPIEVRQRAKSLDLEPRVEFREDTVQVRLVVFTKWGGFKEVLCTVSRDFPHAIIEWEEKELVPYHCGIMF